MSWRTELECLLTYSLTYLVPVEELGALLEEGGIHLSEAIRDGLATARGSSSELKVEDPRTAAAR